MLRLSTLALLSSLIAVLASCNSGDATQPAQQSGIAFDRQPGSCQEITQQQINALFPPTLRGSVSSQLAQIRNDVRQGNTTRAQTEMFQLWQQILNWYYAGSLVGAKSAATQSMVLNMAAQLYCLVGLDGSFFLTGNPLAADNKLQVVFPSSSTQDVVAGNGKGGTRIGGNTLTAPGTVTVVLITDSFDPFKGPLHTKLDQYGPYFEIQILPAQPLNQPVLIAQCIAGWSGGNPPATVHLAHNVGTGIEILAKESSFIDCGATASNGPTASEYFASGETMNGLRALGRAAVASVTPSLAYAGSVGVGGKTTSFSPYGGVDTAVVVEAASSLSQIAPVGSAVPAAPAVRVHTTGANTSLDGANVSFSVTSGGGSVFAIGSADPFTTVNAITDLSGGAAVGSWTVGGGANTVSATAAFPAPASGTGVGINGSPVIFSATGGDIIPWQAAGYRYSPSDVSGFEAPGFDDSGWNSGPAAFGSATPSTLSCPLDGTVATPWTLGSNETPSYLLLRHQFTLPSGWSADLMLAIAIDNDIQVFVNGTNLTANSSSGVAEDGFVTHEGCASRGSSTFTVPHALLHAGTNLLAIRARDRGVVSFVDANLTVPTP